MIIKMVNIHLFMLIFIIFNDKFKPNTQINKTIFKLTKYLENNKKKGKIRKIVIVGLYPFLHIYVKL